MPKFNVHLYTLYREKYVGDGSGIEAASAPDAVELAMAGDAGSAAEIENAEDCPIYALVDPIVEGEPDLDASSNWMMRLGRERPEIVLVNCDGRACDPITLRDLRAELAAFVHLAETLNARQHAGMEITPTMWSTLYQRTNEAKALLAH